MSNVVALRDALDRQLPYRPAVKRGEARRRDKGLTKEEEQAVAAERRKADGRKRRKATVHRG